MQKGGIIILLIPTREKIADQISYNLKILLVSAIFSLVVIYLNLKNINNL